MGVPAIFLDKDGTLVENVPYNVDPERIRLSAGAEEGLRRLQGAGFLLVVISNQSGVARGYFSEDALVAVRERVRQLLADAGAPLAGFYYCPHHPEGSVSTYAIVCSCRKPQPGLLIQAAGELGIDLGRSWLVGDILDDIEAGRRAGCRTVLIDNGNETEWVLGDLRQPHYVARSLTEAAGIILDAEKPAGAPEPESAPPESERGTP